MKTLLLTVICLSYFTLQAQDFQGRAVYKTHNAVSINVSNDKGVVDKSFQKKLKERLKKMSEKTYTLQFNKTTSIYTQNKKLSSEAQSGGVQVFMIGDDGGNDVLYKNISAKNYTNKKEVSGKRFLIEDALTDVAWEITSETKKIGNYTCYKALKTRKEAHKSFIITDGEKEETKKIVDITTTAWYTPEIPVSNGPGMYWGLPGLILEIQEGKQTIACTELVLNPKDKIVIKKPKKGKKISQAKFDELMIEKTKEMMERFNNKRKSKKNGDAIHIEIQG